jgi:hypothetical protein
LVSSFIKLENNNKKTFVFFFLSFLFICFQRQSHYVSQAGIKPGNLRSSCLHLSVLGSQTLITMLHTQLLYLVWVSQETISFSKANFLKSCFFVTVNKCCIWRPFMLSLFYL